MLFARIFAIFMTIQQPYKRYFVHNK